MQMRKTGFIRWAALLAAGLLASITGLTFDGVPGASAAGGGPTSGADGAGQELRGGFDARRGTGAAANASLVRAAAVAAARPATRALKDSLGDDAVVDIDGLTGTPRLVASSTAS